MSIFLKNLKFRKNIKLLPIKGILSLVNKKGFIPVNKNINEKNFICGSIFQQEGEEV
jgi:hypothetical protein